MASFGNVLGTTSCNGTTIPSVFPNIEDRPRQKIVMKKRMAHSGETGILVIASLNTMKAKPVPSTPWAQTEHSVIAKHYRTIDIKHFSSHTQVLNSYFAEKGVKVAGLRANLLEHTRVCFIEMLDHLIVVVLSDAALSKLKCI